MSDLPLDERGANPTFTRRSIGVVVGGGIALFLIMLVLASFSPQWRGADNGRANALSNGATGFSGIVELSRLTERDPLIVRNDQVWREPGLLVITPESGYVEISEAMFRDAGTTLIVFPKWATGQAEANPGWVTSSGPLSADNAERVLAPAYAYEIHRAETPVEALRFPPDGPGNLSFAIPDQLQTIRYEGGASPGSEGVRLEPLITDGEGGIVLGHDGDIFVLADPDLINNLAMADPASAEAALRLLDWLDPTGGVMFDVTLNGYGQTPSVLVLAFRPPFLGMTLALLALAALIALRAATRFGAPAPRQRALALGSAALADSTAALFRKAGRSWTLGDRYAETVRNRAARAFGAPAHVKGAALDEYLDKLGGDPPFSTRARSADAARTDAELLSAARSLADWKKEQV